MKKKHLLLFLLAFFPMLLHAEPFENILIDAEIISIDLQLKDRQGKTINWDRKEIIVIQRSILDIFTNPEKYINQGFWHLIIQDAVYGSAIIEDSNGERKKLFISYWKTQKGISISTEKDREYFYILKKTKNP